jgi:hypothetical protein
VTNLIVDIALLIGDEIGLVWVLTIKDGHITSYI